jgi:hypothetical protein
MSTAAMQIADEMPGETDLAPRDKFNTARKALGALRNAEQHILRRLDQVMPELDVDGKDWSVHEERRLLGIVEHWHREAFSEDVRSHQQRLSKRDANGNRIDSARAMKRLSPPGGKNSAEYKCMFDPDSGTAVSNPAQISRAIAGHWSKTFERRFTPDRRKMEKWLRRLECRFAKAIRSPEWWKVLSKR